MALYHPHIMPDGSFVEVDSGIVDKLHFGDPALGWEGDERLALSWNGQTERVELWRLEDDGEYRLVMRGRPGMRVVDMGIIQFLVTHDRQRGFKLRDAIDAHNAKLDADREKEFDAKVEAAADRLHWALLRDIGQFEGGITRRIMPLPAAPWKRGADHA